MVVNNRRCDLHRSGVPNAAEPFAERGRAKRVMRLIPRVDRRTGWASTGGDRPADARGRCPDANWTTWPDLVILLTMTTFSLADAKAHLSKLVAQVSGQHERVYVTVHGKPSAVLLATEDLESLEETIEILADADTMRRLHASDAELARGEAETQENLEAAMQRRRSGS
jgi:prevent-host-death family protein